MSLINNETLKDRIMLALDMPDAESALSMRDRVGDAVGWMKVGLRLFVAEGPKLVQALAQSHRLFLDLKFHDIPNTVAQAIESAGNLGVDMVNVHAGGGREMLEAAAKAASRFSGMQLIAVTVLTSDSMPMEEAAKVALERACLARECGLNGVVCSMHEVAAIKQVCGNDFVTVTPGIRWGGQDTQDQNRVADPASAVAAGANHLVIGRPILQAENPRHAALEAMELIRGAV